VIGEGMKMMRRVEGDDLGGIEVLAMDGHDMSPIAALRRNGKRRRA
jgi:hypothetical protein